MKPQLESEPAVAGENLAQLVQCGTTLGKGDQALLRRCIGTERGLIAEDPGHVGAGKPAQEKAQTFDDRAAIAGIGLGQERPITASPISHSQSSITDLAARRIATGQR